MRIKALAAGLLLANRYGQTVRVDVLCEPSAEHILGLLQTRHVVLDHSLAGDYKTSIVRIIWEQRRLKTDVWDRIGKCGIE